MTAVTHLVVGPPEHGVTRYALRLAGAAPSDPVVHVRQRLDKHSVAAVLARLPGRDGHVHVHVTDHLFGASPDEAADVLEQIGRQVPTTVTLHDLPQASDGRRQQDRARSYARVVATSRGAVVSSRHELGLLRELLGDADPSRLAVVDHVVEAIATPRPDGATAQRDVVVLGFVYPGKGHDEALDALATTDPDVGLVALGRPSPGHDDLVDDLARRAGEQRRRFVCTGWLEDAEVHRRLVTAAVPLVAHQHVSASGSLATWLSVGRRPVVPRNRYAEEVEARLPGALRVVDDLADGVRHALARPASTWLDDDVVLGPSAAEAAARLQQLVEAWS